MLGAVWERVETGPLQFANDWPGYFIRGDEALITAAHLERLVADCERNEVPLEPEDVFLLRDLADRFNAVRVDAPDVWHHPRDPERAERLRQIATDPKAPKRLRDLWNEK